MPRSALRSAFVSAVHRLTSRLGASTVLGLLLLGAVASCRDGASGPLGERAVSIALRPTYSLAAAPGDRPINRVRLVATDAEDSRELGRLEENVDPQAAEWPLTLDVRIPGGSSVEVMVTIELLNVDGSATSVEWSGRAGPILVRSSRSEELANVSLGRGPLDNLAVTGVTLTDPPASLEEGATHLGVVNVTGASGAIVFWTSLDPSVATVDGAGLATTLRDGTARIVAAAGAHADTITLSVTARPAAVTFAPDTLRLSSLGVSGTLVATVRDPRGVALPAFGVMWSVADAAIAANLGGGSFRSVANGTTAVTATVVGRTVSGSSAVKVAQTVASAVISPRGLSLPGIGSTGTLTLDVRDANNQPMPTALRSWTTANASIVTVSATGVVTAVARGSAYVRGASAGVIDSVLVTVTAGVPTSLAKHTGDAQTATVNTLTAEVPRVIVKDESGAPVAGATVTFTPGATSGSVGNSTAVTDAEGIASAGSWRLGTTAGPQSLVATLGSLTTTFTATGVAGPAVALAKVSGDGQSGTSGVALANPIVVRAIDAHGNPVSGIGVTWSNSHDGTFAPSSGTTDAAGLTQTSFTPGFANTAQTVTASAPSVTPALFDVVVTIPPPSVILALADVDRVSLGRSHTMNVTITRPAPAGGVTVNVTSDNTSVLTVGSTVFFAEGATTGTVTVTGQAIGTTTVRGNAAGYIEGTRSVTVELRAISAPATLTVPFGQTASLPITLTNPAPPGGLVVTVSSSDAASVEVQTPTVTIAAGAITGSATVFGKNPGVATITMTAPNFDQRATTATTAASLDITTTTASLNASFGTTILIRFTSAGVATPAPSPGVTVNLVALDPACVGVPATATIPTGLVDVTVPLNYTGPTNPPCSSRVRATATNIQPDSVTANVAVRPGISMSAQTVAARLMNSTSGSLGASNHGGVIVRLTSTDPARVLVSPNLTTAGTDFIDIPVLDGNVSFSYVTHGVDTATSGASIVASATGFNNGTSVVTMAQPAIDIISMPTSTTTLSPDINFQVRTGVPSAPSGGRVISLSDIQPIRAGGSPITVTVSTSTPSIAQLVTTAGGAASSGTVTIAAQASSSPGSVATGGIAFRPVAQGLAIVTASAPGFTTTDNAIDSITVAQPIISVGVTTVGAGLQNAISFSLGAAVPTGGRTFTLTSADPTKMLLSRNAVTAGVASIDTLVPEGRTTVTFYVHGVEGQTGTVAANVSAPGYANGSGNQTIVQPAVQIISLAAAHTTLEAPVGFQARIGTPSGTSTLSDIQAIRAGAPNGPVTVTFTSSDPSVATLQTSAATAGSVTAQIAVGASTTPSGLAAGGVLYDALSAGSTTITASIPGFTTTTSAIVATTVTAPTISVGGSTTGSGLMTSASISWSTPTPTPLTLRVQSADPAKLLVSGSSTTVGTAFVDFSLVAGQTNVSYWVHGVEGQTGAVVVTASMPGYTNGTRSVSIVQPALDLVNLVTPTTALTPDAPFYVRIGIPNTVTPTPTGLNDIQPLRPGSPGITATVTTGTPSVLSLVQTAGEGSTATVRIEAGQQNSPTTVSAGGVAQRAKTTGTSVVTATIPGFVTTTAGARTVTVNAPAIALSTTTAVGSGLMQIANGNLGAASQHGGIRLTLTSSDPSVAMLAPNATTAAAASITIDLANGATSFSYYVHGIEAKTGTVSIQATAPGFTNGSATQSIVAPAVELSNLSSSMTAAAADDPFFASVGVANASLTDLADIQQLRFGGSGLTVTFTSSNTAAGVVKTSTASGGTVTATIAPGVSNTPTTLAAGGVVFDPIAAGTSTVNVSAPGFTQVVNATSGAGTGRVVVTVNP